MFPLSHAILRADLDDRYLILRALARFVKRCANARLEDARAHLCPSTFEPTM